MKIALEKGSEQPVGEASRANKLADPGNDAAENSGTIRQPQFAASGSVGYNTRFA
jgi:hypothetical protein